MLSFACHLLAYTTLWCLLTAAVFAVGAENGPIFPDSNVQCSDAWLELPWPTFHLLNNVTKRPGQQLDMEPLNDANAIFRYKGLWHAMFQSGDGPPSWGYRWAHKVSNDLVRWFPVADALTPNMTKGAWDDLGPCDGTVSFPNLGEAPFDGGSPIVLYGPDCGKPLSPLTRSSVGDVPRVELALPSDPDDPYLLQWVNSDGKGPVTFDGTPCSFPGRVWKSQVGEYWNMLCILNGTGPWVRFTSDDPALMHWKYSNKTFVQGAIAGGGAGAMFHRIPNAPDGGPTHLINAGTGEQFFLGTYDPIAEVFTVTTPPQRLDCSTGDNFNWAAVGTNGRDPMEFERLLIIAWIYGPPAPSAISLIRDISFDRAANHLISYPVPEYTKLRNKVYLRNHSLGLIAANESKALPLPSGAGGTIDVSISFDIHSNTSKGFGFAVRAPPDKYAGVAAVVMTVEEIGAPDLAGNRNIRISFVTPDPKTVHDSNAQATVLLLHRETLDVRVLIDKPIIEFFVMGGRAAYVAADMFYSPSNSSIHVFNNGAFAVAASSVSAYGMGCGWSHTKPIPVAETWERRESIMI